MLLTEIATLEVRSWRERPDWLVEPFRRADWADVRSGVGARIR